MCELFFLKPPLSIHAQSPSLSVASKGHSHLTK